MNASSKINPNNLVRLNNQYLWSLVSNNINLTDYVLTYVCKFRVVQKNEETIDKLYDSLKGSKIKMGCKYVDK